jgi:Tol biopolymer transport system component
VPGIDDRLRRDLDRLAKGAEATASLDRVARRKRRHRTARRVQTAALAAVVLAATAGGGYALTRAFRQETSDVASPPAVRNGKIAFVSDRDGNNEIYLMDPDGSNVVRLTNNPGEDLQPAWSPDGTQIAFVSHRSGAQELHVMNADGTGVRRITESSRLVSRPGYPDWSPDGSMIAFSADVSIECTPLHCSTFLAGAIFVVPSTADRSRSWTNLSEVDPPLSVAPRYERAPSWSPDGGLILFDSIESQPLFEKDPGPTDPSGGYVLSADGTNRQALQGPTRPFQVGLADWSPNDNRLALVQSPDEVLVGRIDGFIVQDMRVVARRADADEVSFPTWSPDGTRIAYVVKRGDNADIYVMDWNGGGGTNITGDSLSSDGDPAWQPVPPGAPTIEPTTPEPAETSPSPTPTSPEQPQPTQEEFELKFGPLCGFSGAFGDFDGDGERDSAGIAFPKASEACTDLPGKAGWFVYVMWASGPSGTWPLDVCSLACRTFGVADLDGDGTDELFLVVSAGAATLFLHVYELGLGPQPKHPLEVAPPGASGYPADEPALFPYGGSVTHQDFVTCDEGDGVHILIATSADLDQKAEEWSVRETILSLEGEGFAIVSTRDYQVAYDPSGEEPLPVPGDPCFALD